MQAPLTTFIVILAAFLLLMAAEAISYRNNSRGLENVLFGKGNLAALIRKHIDTTVILSLAVITYTMIEGSNGLLLLPNGKNAWLALTALVLLTAFFLGARGAAQRISITDQYSSQIVLSDRLATSYLMLRTLFLIVYEFFFRGIMLEAGTASIGVAGAVAINTLMYFVAHLFGSRKEIIGTVPFGLLLCLLTIKLQSVWPAACIHLALALAYETKLIHHKKTNQ